VLHGSDYDLLRKPLGEPAPQASNLALAVILLVVLLLQTIFNAWQDFSTRNVLSSIKDMLPSAVVALRDGQERELAASELVPGDLVHIRLGQKLPADLRLIEVSSDLKFDRSVLTGEVHLATLLTSRPSLTTCHTE
jgi:sodium/potassium-transporting ATPase subunit alpha